MYKLNFKKRVWVVKQYNNGESVLDVALSQKIDRRTIYKILDKYEEFGWDGLKDHKTGRSETVLNKNTEILIFDLRKYGYGACNRTNLEE